MALTRKNLVKRGLPSSFSRNGGLKKFSNPQCLENGLADFRKIFMACGSQGPEIGEGSNFVGRGAKIGQNGISGRGVSLNGTLILWARRISDF